MSLRQTTLTGNRPPTAQQGRPPPQPRGHHNNSNNSSSRGAHSTTSRNNNSSTAWMEALWELHCGSPLANAVRYTDPIVEAMWEVFQPLLSQLDVYPLSIPEAIPETVDAASAAAIPFTDFIVLSLVDVSAAAAAAHQHGRRTHRHSNGGNADDLNGEDEGGSPGNALTSVMRSALLDQPKIVLALIEFFVAVWLYQYEARRLAAPAQGEGTAATTLNGEHSSHDNGTDRGVGGVGGVPHQTSANVAAAAAAAPALRRVYAAVSGDARHATPFDHLGAAQLGRLLTIKGTIVRMSPTRISCLRMAYRCGHCGVVKTQATEDGVLTYPGPCASARCRGYKWVALTEQAVCEEVQLLRLQEHTTFFDASPSPANNNSNNSTSNNNNNNNSAGGGGSGGMHVMIEVELRPPWLDAVTVGDGVCVCGVLETRRSEGKQGGGMQQVCLRARAVHGLRSQGGSSSSSTNAAAAGGGGYGAGAAILQHRQRNASSLFTSVTGGMGAGGGGVDDPWRLTRNGSGSLHAGLLGNSTDQLEETLAPDESESGFNEEGDLPNSNRNRPGVPHATRAAAVLQALPGSGLDSWSAEETGRYYEMARHPQWFARLTASVAPAIFGMELVKQALLLAIVGGNRDKNGGETRSSIHLLLVGDPGLGKSQLLRAACAVAPRSAFVCTHTSSSCGLTMTLTRDPVSGETTFEAGAVVHGDGGITCLDEIDKGVQEHKALLEVMEQETVSLAKAGMIFSMPVHTSVLAAGNPIGGSFDVSKSLAANVNLSPALMSRFDIVACLRNPHGTSGAVQQALTDHVLQWHRHGAHGDRANRHPPQTYNNSNGKDNNNNFNSNDGSYNGGDSSSPAHRHASSLPLSLVRRFLLFCRSQCQPTLCKEASDVLLAHYLAQRQHLPEPQYNFPSSDADPRFSEGGVGGRGSGYYGPTGTSGSTGGLYGGGGSATPLPANPHHMNSNNRNYSSTTASHAGAAGAGLGLEGTVTPRYLQALIRVSEARAKLELRHEVTREDAQYAVQLLQSCLHSFDGLAAPGSAVAAGAAGAGGSGGKKSAKLNQRDAVLQRLKQMIVEENRGANLFSEQAILDVCEAVGCRSAPAMFRQLNEFGFLLQKGGSTYCLRGC